MYLIITDIVNELRIYAEHQRRAVQCIGTLNRIRDITSHYSSKKQSKNTILFSILRVFNELNTSVQRT